MNIEDMLDINDCPLCDGGALLEEECGCGYYVIQLRLIFIQKKKGWMPPKGQLCFGIRERLFQAVRENDFHTVKCNSSAFHLLHS